MQIISTFFICVIAGFFVYPMVSRLTPSGVRTKDASERIMKESLQQMSEDIRSPFNVLKRKSFKVKK